MPRFALWALLTLTGLPTASAQAHGPCGCLEPASGPPGTQVTAAYPIYTVIFNPDRADLGIGPKSLWGLHQPGTPVTVYRTSWRYSKAPLNRGGSFTIPAARPGRYLVALYDGDEGGQHYSWGSFTVTAGKAVEPATTWSRSASWRPSVVLAVGGMVVALVVGVGIGHGLSRRGRRGPGS